MTVLTASLKDRRNVFGECNLARRRSGRLALICRAQQYQKQKAESEFPAGFRRHD
jgi:hypothetical protein